MQSKEIKYIIRELSRIKSFTLTLPKEPAPIWRSKWSSLQGMIEMEEARGLRGSMAPTVAAVPAPEEPLLADAPPMESPPPLVNVLPLCCPSRAGGGLELTLAMMAARSGSVARRLRRVGCGVMWVCGCVWGVQWGGAGRV